MINFFLQKFVKKNQSYFLEDDVKILNENFDNKISKKLKIFYNPKMKVNRDIDLLFIKSINDLNNKQKKLKYFDGMCSSGIREIRILKNLGFKFFSKIYLCDLKKSSILNFKKNLKLNNLKKILKNKNFNLYNKNFFEIIVKDNFDYIVVDPFGSPINFLDISFQKINHNGFISITATDTATLCSKYQKTNLRRYGEKLRKELFYNEIGIRNLLTTCIKISAKHDKKIIPQISFSKEHFYKIIIKVVDNKKESTNDLENLKYFKVLENQKIEISDFQKNENYFGKIYIQKINEKIILEKMIKNLDLIKENIEVKKLLEELKNEVEVFASYEIHKLKYNKGFSKLFEKIKKENYEISKVHNEKFLVKTNCPHNKFIKILKEI